MNLAVEVVPDCYERAACFIHDATFSNYYLAEDMVVSTDHLIDLLAVSVSFLTLVE